MESNNKRIAKNTLLLYFRMILTMFVSLYTVRVVLETLGVVDYGLYNVVGGIVTMLSFLSTTLSAASQRFFSFEIGKNNQEQLKKVFSMTITIYSLLAVVILIMAETIGLWFLNTKMVIPVERIEAANWVYQFSIFSFIIMMFTAPFNAIIIARERMNVYAWVSIIEVLLKLLVIYLLVILSVDKLKAYAVLTFVVICIVSLIYRTYSQRKFQECQISFYWDVSLFKELVAYSGWNLFGALSLAFNNQGINIVLNLFFGTLVNAAYGIAYQVNSAINQFVQNFMIATRPQIIKYYAAGEKERMLALVFQSSKFSFLLLFIITVPVLLETDFIFGIWLRDIPNNVTLFTRLLIIIALIDSLSYSLMAAAQATGNIKKYTSVVGGLMLLSLPISFLFLRFGFPSYTVFLVGITNSIVCFSARLVLLNEMIKLPITRYFRIVIFPIFLVIIVVYTLSLIVCWSMSYSILRFFIVVLISFLCSIVAIYFLGLSKGEKSYFNEVILKLYNKHISNGFN